MSDYAGANLLRLMAAGELSVAEVAQRSALDERTIRGITGGSHRPHARTLHRLAGGLGVSVDEFFLDPAQLLYRRFDRRFDGRFDRQTNPVVAEVLQQHAELFEGWGEADFDELHSRVGTGGPLTFDGAVTAVRHMNHKHALHDKLDVLLESSQAKTVSGLLELLYEQVVAGTVPGSGVGAAPGRI
jgi:transcriptional regulator with XRE-family HTH domain